MTVRGRRALLIQSDAKPAEPLGMGGECGHRNVREVRLAPARRGHVLPPVAREQRRHRTHGPRSLAPAASRTVLHRDVLILSKDLQERFVRLVRGAKWRRPLRWTSNGLNILVLVRASGPWAPIEQGLIFLVLKLELSVFREQVQHDAVSHVIACLHLGRQPHVRLVSQ